MEEELITETKLPFKCLSPFLFASVRKVKVEKVVIRAFTTLVRSSKEIKILR